VAAAPGLRDNEEHAMPEQAAASEGASAFAHYNLSSYKFALAESFVALHMAEELEDKANEAATRPAPR
jgi:hypothetical protein